MKPSIWDWSDMLIGLDWNEDGFGYARDAVDYDAEIAEHVVERTPETISTEDLVAA